MSLRDRFRPQATAPAPIQEAAEARASQVLAAKRGRATIAPAPPASKAVASLLRPLMRDTGVGFNELRRRWADIAGESFARTTPEKFAAGTLILRAPSALAPFLQQQIPLLIERLKTAGVKIKAVRIEQRSATPRPAANIRPARAFRPEEEAALAQALDHVGDPGLKSALMRLGRAVKQG